MLIVDAHLDLAWNALQWNRDLLVSAHTIRVHEGTVPGPGRAHGTVALPELRAGRVALCFATLLVRSTGSPVAHLDVRSAAQAFGIARGQLAYYRALEQAGHVRIIGEKSALQAHMAAWREGQAQPEAGDTPPLGLVISTESADAILSPEQLAEWHALGVRVVGPAHYGPGRYAGGTGTETGMTAPGLALLRQMEQCGVLLDLTHLSDQAFWQALDHYGGPVLASHNNCRALVPHQRQFDDAQLRAIIARGGVIGAACDAWMLRAGWQIGGRDNQPVHLADMVDHIDHICQIAGNSAHVGIGSDLDGGFGREQSPADLDTIADLQRITAVLAARGYAPADIAAIMHGNWLGLLERAWS